MRLVRSPFVAEVLDTDVTGDMPYIVTQYVPGRTLDDVVREDGPMPGGRAGPSRPAGWPRRWPRCTGPGWCTGTSSRAT